LFNMATLTTFLIIGLIFSPFAGLMAGIITYEEYKHHYTSNNEPTKEAIKTGVFAFLVFFLIAVVTGFIVGYLVKM